MLSSAAGDVNSEEMKDRALAALPNERSGVTSAAGPQLAISMIGSPAQSILRPSQLEAQAFQRDLQQKTLFGEPSIFSTDHGIQASVQDHYLTLSQNGSSLRIGEDGSIRLILKLPSMRHGLAAIIQEDVEERISTGLQFSLQLIDSFDPTERLSHLAAAVALLNTSYSGWRTRREHQESPNSMTITHGFEEQHARVTLSPPHRTRAAFRNQLADISTDLTTLLRRMMRGRG